MTSTTLKIRLAALLRKSQKAVSLYSDVSHENSNALSETDSLENLMQPFEDDSGFRGAGFRGDSEFRQDSFRNSKSSISDHTRRGRGASSLNGQRVGAVGQSTGQHSVLTTSQSFSGSPRHLRSSNHASLSGTSQSSHSPRSSMSNRDVTGPSANRFEKRFSNGQIGVWRQVNEDLSRLLHDALQVSSVTSLARAAFEIRDGLYSEWRKLQSELHLKREALLHAAEGDQFVKAALYSEQLVLLKARVQATRAALHEVEKALGDTVASYSSLHHFTEGKNVNFGEMNPVMGGQGGDDNLHSM